MFPLLHLKGASTTHFKFWDYDGQHLRVLQRSCQQDSSGICTQTSATTVRDNVTESIEVPASFVNPLGDGSEFDIDGVVELQDFTWRALQTDTGRVQYVYNSMPTGRPTFFDEGTLAQTQFAVTGQGATCSGAVPQLQAVSSADGQPLPENELTCYHSEPCSFDLKAAALTEPIKVHAAVGFEKLCTVFGEARCGCQESLGGEPHACTQALAEEELLQQRSGTAVVRCFVAESGGCFSPPLCVKVAVRSHAPVLVAPTPLAANAIGATGALLPDSTDVPECLGEPLELVINATDADAGDSVRVFLGETPDADRVGFFAEQLFEARGGQICAGSPFAPFGAARIGDNRFQTEERNGVYVKRECSDGGKDCSEAGWRCSESDRCLLTRAVSHARVP